MILLLFYLDDECGRFFGTDTEAKITNGVMKMNFFVSFKSKNILNTNFINF